MNRPTQYTPNTLHGRQMGYFKVGRGQKYNLLELGKEGEEEEEEEQRRCLQRGQMEKKGNKNREDRKKESMDYE